MKSTNKYNPLIFGKDNREGITNIYVDGAGAHIYKQNTLDPCREKYKPWVLKNKDYKNKLIELSGDQYYKYVKEMKFFEYKKTNPYLIGTWKPRSISEGYMIKTGTTCFKGMKPSDLSIMSIDIETTTLDPKSFDAEILVIGCSYRGSDGSRKNFVFDIKNHNGVMIEELEEVVYNLNPDLIVGHNIIGFDLNYILELYGSCRIGRSTRMAQKDARISKFRKDGSQQYDYNNIIVPGRDVIDTMFLSMKYDLDQKEKFPSYGLKVIEKHLGLGGKDRIEWDFQRDPPSGYKSWSDEKWENFKKYCSDDCDTPIKLVDMMLPPFFYLAQSCPKSMQQIINEGTGGQIDSMMIRSYLQEGYSIPKASKKIPYEGAISLGVPGMYKHVRKIDVASLYPSIMLDQNIYDEDKDPNKNLLGILKYLREERLFNKKKLKETGDENYDHLQSAQKRLINSMYGFMGAGYLLFNYPEGASRITAIGRGELSRVSLMVTGCEPIKAVKKIVHKGKPNERKEYHWALTEPKFDTDFKIVNMDTDSISYTNNLPLGKTEFKDDLEWVNSNCSHLIVWEDDGIYDKVIVLKAKNYVLKKGSEVVFKGSSLTDQKKEPLFKVVLESSLKLLLNDELNDYIRSNIDYFLALIESRVGDMRPERICTKRTITKAVLNPKRLQEQKILDACNEAIDKGVITGINEGDKILLYRRENGKLKFPQLYDYDHDREHYKKRLYATIKIIEPVYDLTEIDNMVGGSK